MKLSNIRNLGRFHNKEQNKTVNIRTGRKVGYGVDLLFYLKSGSRVFVSDKDFYDNWEKV
jgi:SH3-like domain-containing protein